MRTTYFTLTTILAAVTYPVLGYPHRATDGRWTTLPLLLLPRQEHSVAALEDRIYVAGGILSNNSSSSTIYTTSTVQYFDLGLRKWYNAAPLPLSINHGNLAAVDGKLFLLGGLSGTNLSSWNALGDAFVYHPQRNQWSPLTPMPAGTARGSSAVATLGDDIYLAGGMTQLQLTAERVQASVTTVTSYNTRTNTWRTDYPPLPGARDHVAGAIIDHTFYVTGGRDRGQYNWRNDTWALNLRNVSAGWTVKAPMPTARGGLAYASLNNRLYTFGGEGNPQNPTTMVFDNVEVYHPISDSWQQLRRMKVPRHGVGAVAVGRRIYIPGGGLRISAAPTSHFDALDLF